MDAIRKRVLSKLNYIKPELLRRSVVPTVVKILQKNVSANHLSGQQRKEYLEKHHAACLAIMMGQIIGQCGEVTVCVREDEDFDCVLRSIEDGCKAVYRPFQLKQLPSHTMNQCAKIQAEIDKLKKYGTNLAVSFWINRDVTIEFQKLKLDGVNIQQLWFLGGSSVGETLLHGGTITELKSGVCWEGILKDGKSEIRRRSFKC